MTASSLYGGTFGLRPDSVFRCRRDIPLLWVMVSSTRIVMEFHYSQSISFVCLLSILH
jgi:hypothetical protein